MTKYQVINRHYRNNVITDDAAKATVAAAMRAKAVECESVIAVHRNDKLIQLYRVLPTGHVTRGQRIDGVA